MRRPWLKFYPNDWRSDPALRSCSVAARGLWMEMICVMHEATSRGDLTIGNLPVSPRQLASISGVPLKEANRLLDELEAAGVFSRNGEIIYSRRMKREEEKAERDKANGALGGNPQVKGGVNPPVKAEVKAHILDTRDQKEDAAAPPSDDQEKQLFERGKQVLGQDAGGLIAKLLKAKGKNIAAARAVIETASNKQKPREYVGGVLRGQGGDDAAQFKQIEEVMRKKGSAVVFASEIEGRIPGVDY